MRFISRQHKVTDMKLRLRGQSLRLRLTRGEVSQLVSKGRIEENVQVGPAVSEGLVYRLEVSDSGGEVTASFRQNQIIIAVPSESARDWALGSEVGIYGKAPWGLTFAIEKDFKCLEHRPNEDDTDAFEHPTGVAGAGCAVV